MKDADRAVAALAAQQRQVFTRGQAQAAGVSASGITRRLANGLYRPVGPHTLTFAGVALDWRGRLQAGLLDLGPDAMVAAEAAAGVHGLDGFGEGPLVFLVPRTQRHRPAAGDVVTTSHVSRLDRVMVDGLPVTSGTRTVVELIGRVDPTQLANALDTACRMGLTAPSVVERRLRELGRQGRRGVAEFDAVMADAGVQSWLERRFRRLLRGSGLPTPTVQRVYRRGEDHVARVDFDVAPHPVIVEVGGRRGYLSYAERQRQEHRRNAMQLLGLTIYFFTRDDVNDRPTYVLSTLTAAIRLAS